MLVVRFLHYLGVSLWIGGWLSVALMTSGARGNSAQTRATIASLAAKVQIMLIGPGALVTLGSGILWSMAIVVGGGVESRVAPTGLWIMTGAGIVGSILVALFVIPIARKVRAVAVSGEEGRLLPVFDKLDKRLGLVSAVAGILALVSLGAAVLAP